MLALDLRLVDGSSSTAGPEGFCKEQGKHGLEQRRRFKTCNAVAQCIDRPEWQTSPAAAAAGFPDQLLRKPQETRWVQLRSWQSRRARAGRHDAAGAQSEGCPAARASPVESPPPAHAVKCLVSVTFNTSLMPTSWAQQACQHHCGQPDALPLPDDHVPEKHAAPPELPAASIAVGRSHKHSSHLAASLL